MSSLRYGAVSSRNASPSPARAREIKSAVNSGMTGTTVNLTMGSLDD
ncbi:MAG: hypothetical protein ACXWD5_16840 [Mycobacterium sp.]